MFWVRLVTLPGWVKAGIVTCWFVYSQWKASRYGEQAISRRQFSPTVWASVDVLRRQLLEADSVVETACAIPVWSAGIAVELGVVRRTRLTPMVRSVDSWFGAVVEAANGKGPVAEVGPDPDVKRKISGPGAVREERRVGATRCRVDALDDELQRRSAFGGFVVKREAHPTVNRSLSDRWAMAAERSKRLGS